MVTVRQRAFIELYAGAKTACFEQVSSFRCQHFILCGKQRKPHATVYAPTLMNSLYQQNSSTKQSLHNNESLGHIM